MIARYIRFVCLMMYWGLLYRMGVLKLMKTVEVGPSVELAGLMKLMILSVELLELAKM